MYLLKVTDQPIDCCIESELFTAASRVFAQFTEPALLPQIGSKPSVVLGPKIDRHVVPAERVVAIISR
jgi:hypothetical protein